MMKALKILFFMTALLVLLGIGAIISAGLLIPAERGFTNEIEINAPVEKVWQVITDKKRYLEWQTQIENVEVIDEKNWIEYPKGVPDPLKFRVANDERPARMEFEYTMGDTYAGKWKGEIIPMGSGVRLRTDDSYHAKSWMTKIFVYTFFDLETFAKDWNTRLKRRVETLDQ